MKRHGFAALFLFVLLFPLTAHSADELHMYAGAGLRIPTEVIVKQFEKEKGVKVNVEYAGMGQLLTRAELTGSGDVFLSGSRQYVDQLRQNGKVLEAHDLVYHTAVMAILKSKGEGINTYKDLATSNLRIAMGDPKAIALGKAGEAILDASGYGEELRAKVAVRGTTIKQVLMYLLNNDVDAAIIGRSDAVLNADKLKILPEPEGIEHEVSQVAALSSSKHPELAKELAAYFARPESIKVFTDRGYLPVTR